MITGSPCHPAASRSSSSSLKLTDYPAWHRRTTARGRRSRGYHREGYRTAETVLSRKRNFLQDLLDLSYEPKGRQSDKPGSRSRQTKLATTLPKISCS